MTVSGSELKKGFVCCDWILDGEELSLFEDTGAEILVVIG